MKITITKDYPYADPKTNKVITFPKGTRVIPCPNKSYNVEGTYDYYGIEEIIASPDWFSIEYEIGDYVKRVKGAGSLKIGGIYPVAEKSNGSGLLIYNDKTPCACDQSYFIPATQSEIEAYKKEHEAKFPYEYKVNSIPFLAEKSDDTLYLTFPDQMITPIIWLDKKSFLEIGKRMNWI